MFMRPNGTNAAALRIRRFPTLLLVAVAALLGSAPLANAGSDDFEFGQALAKKGQETGSSVWFDYAKTIYDNILADKNRSAADHKEARYGLATLTRGEALAAAGSSKYTYAEVKALFDTAVNGIERFVTENPDHPNVIEAKMAAGETRLNFVQWARGLLEDVDMMADRKADEDVVLADARDMIRGALQYFAALDTGWDSMEASLVSQLAHYHWVTCRYYEALVYPNCSTAAIEALKGAGESLEEFISFFDGQLVAIFAQDFYGLSNWELARCANAEDNKTMYYRAAVDWFDTCIQTELTNRDSLRIIARGYLHIAQCCLDAGRVGGENFLKRARRFLSKMQKRVPPILTTVDGIKALIEWGKIERSLDNADKAVQIFTQAKEAAQTTGRIWLVNVANRETGKTLPEMTGGSSSVGASVLKSVADDQFVAKRYASAIGAYQSVIQAAGDSTEDLMNYVVPSWERIAQCYYELGDMLSAALAAEPVHAAWVDGRIPRKSGDKNDPNLKRTGDLRLRAQRALEELWKKTGAATYRVRYTEVRDSFTDDYTGHPATEALDFRVAMQKYNLAREEKKAKRAKWKTTMGEAIKRFEKVAKDDKSAAQQAAQIQLIRAENIKQNWSGMVARADEAARYWDSASMQKLMKAQPTIAGRVAKARGRAKYWKSTALVELKKWDAVIKTLDGFQVRHGELAEVILSGAMGSVVQAYIGKGDITEATTWHKKLLRQYPNYFRLPKITFGLAGYYEDQYLAIEAKYKAVSERLDGPAGERDKGLRSRWVKAKKRLNGIAETLIDLNGARNKAEEFVRYWEDKVIAEKQPTKYTVKDYTRFKRRLDGSDKWTNKDLEFGKETFKVGLLKTIEILEKQLKETKAKASGLGEQVQQAFAELETYKAAMYPPLKRAADFYWEWDQSLKGDKVRERARSAKNLSTFAYRFFYATVLKPDDEDSWEKARSLYEDYVGMSGATEDGKSIAAARLGRIYSHLSELAPTEAKKKELSLEALKRLQAAIAKVPANTALLVRQLAGELVVVPWPGEIHTKETFRIPLPRVQDVAELKRVVSQLGSKDAPLPKFRQDRDQTRFETEVKQFKQYVAKMTNAAAGKFVGKFKGGGFDPLFYRLHAKTQAEFRISLARVYALSSRAEDIRKALNLIYTLTSTSLRTPQGETLWWEATVIKMRAYLQGARIGLKSGENNVKAEAKGYLESAGQALKGLYSNDESLGEDVREGTPAELREILGRLNAMRRSAGMSVVNLKLK